jgi:hypothetical protein
MCVRERACVCACVVAVNGCKRLQLPATAPRRPPCRRRVASRVATEPHANGTATRRSVRRCQKGALRTHVTARAPPHLLPSAPMQLRTPAARARQPLALAGRPPDARAPTRDRSNPTAPRDPTHTQTHAHPGPRPCRQPLPPAPGVVRGRALHSKGPLAPPRRRAPSVGNAAQRAPTTHCHPARAPGWRPGRRPAVCGPSPG